MAGGNEATQILEVGHDAALHSNVPALTLANPQKVLGVTALGASPGQFAAAPPVLGESAVGEIGADEGKQKKIIMAVAGVLLLGVLALVGLSDQSSLNSLLSILDLASSEEVAAPRPVAAKKSAEVALKLVNPTKSNEKDSSKASNVSIWSKIENEMDDSDKQAGPPLTGDQEATFKAALTHEFTYQRYKAVIDLAALNAKGSENLLRDALESPKLWTRMRALMALANVGDEITTEDIQKGLGTAHSELRARFFKRFERSPCDGGCYYIARASLPHLDDLGREAALRVIARGRDTLRDRFMVAATFDVSERVRDSARTWLDGHAVGADVWAEVRSLAGP